MTKKISGICLLVLGGLIFLLACYGIVQNTTTKIEYVNEAEIYKAVDGKIIMDEQSRKEHNKHVFEMKRLDLELNKIKGQISEYEESLQLLDIDWEEDLAKINENRNNLILITLQDGIKYGYIIMFIGLGIAFGGFILFKRGRKDSQLLSDTFKFD